MPHYDPTLHSQRAQPVSNGHPPLPRHQQDVLAIRRRQSSFSSMLNLTETSSGRSLPGCACKFRSRLCVLLSRPCSRLGRADSFHTGTCNRVDLMTVSRTYAMLKLIIAVGNARNSYLTRTWIAYSCVAPSTYLTYEALLLTFERA